MYGDRPKYLIVESASGCILPIVFHNILDHIAVAGGLTVLGAGEVHLQGTPDGTISVSCFGRSVTLGVESRGADDAILIERLLNEE